jgi:hypothetical protein
VDRSRQAHSSRQVTICKTCRLGIFQGQQAVWSSGAVLGLVHDACGDGTAMDTTQVNLKHAYGQVV